MGFLSLLTNDFTVSLFGEFFVKQAEHLNKTWDKTIDKKSGWMGLQLYPSHTLVSKLDILNTQFK